MYNLAEKLLIRWSDPVEIPTLLNSPETELREELFARFLQSFRACQEKHRSLMSRYLHQKVRRIIHESHPVGEAADLGGTNKSCGHRGVAGVGLRLLNRGRELSGRAGV